MNVKKKIIQKLNRLLCKASAEKITYLLGNSHQISSLPKLLGYICIVYILSVSHYSFSIRFHKMHTIFINSANKTPPPSP